MATYAQIPGNLGLAVRAGDDFSTLVSFSVDLTGFSLSTVIYSTITGSPVMTPTATLTDASAGQVNISLTDTQTSSLVPGTYRWELVATKLAVTRTYLVGFVEVVK